MMMPGNLVCNFLKKFLSFIGVIVARTCILHKVSGAKVGNLSVAKFDKVSTVLFDKVSFLEGIESIAVIRGMESTNVGILVSGNIAKSKGGFRMKSRPLIMSPSLDTL